MVNPAHLGTQLPVGGTDLSALRRAARENSPEAIKAVAQQFESLMVNMMMKSMREATPKSGLFDNEQTRLYMSLLDQQLSQSLAKRGMGLADALTRQMMTVNGVTPAQGKTSETASTEQIKQGLQQAIRLQQANALSGLMNLDDEAGDRKNDLGALLSSQASLASTSVMETYRQALADAKKEAIHAADASPPHVQAFQKRLSAIAESVSAQSGIPAKFMLAQAALETGWGRNVMRCEDGSSSHNLFGIKAGKGWHGKVVESVTTEYSNGVAYRTTEKFRAYDSFEESFRDYAHFLQSNPRYQAVLASGQDANRFAQSLQAAGYATDPNYASKLSSIIQTRLSA